MTCKAGHDSGHLKWDLSPLLTIQVMKVQVLVNKEKHLQTAANIGHFKIDSALFVRRCLLLSFDYRESQDNQFSLHVQAGDW